MTFNVAALYVDPVGPYPHLVADWWDEERDATRYAGPARVIAHPPCGPWGRLHTFCKHDDKCLALVAVDQVRKWGGVLEHPADSKLWAAAGLPYPGDLFADEFGGRSYFINQSDYGHPCPKATWLYAVGLAPCPFHLPRSYPAGRVASQSSKVRHLTPPEFARRLCEWAST